MLKKICAGLNAAVADLRDALRDNKPTFSFVEHDTGYSILVRTTGATEVWRNVEVINPEYSNKLFSELVRFGLRAGLNVVGAQVKQEEVTANLQAVVEKVKAEIVEKLNEIDVQLEKVRAEVAKKGPTSDITPTYQEYMNLLAEHRVLDKILENTKRAARNA